MNIFGCNFRIVLFGESHSPYLGITIDGCPPGITIDTNDFINDLNRRRPNLIGTTQRQEDDIPIIISGVFNNKTTGIPITILFQNTHNDANAYSRQIMRPSHSDFVAACKYNDFNDFRGGGMFSGRMTLPLVTAGVIAKKVVPNMIFSTSIISIGGINNLTNTNTISNEIKELINVAKQEGNSLGGVIECVIKNTPSGLGEPFFNNIEGMLSHLIFSIPGIKAIEFGTGFNIAKMKGNEANDCYINSTNNFKGKTVTNNSGGINGGISNGNDIVFRVAMRPTPSISIKQETYNFKEKSMQQLEIKGQHDTCFAVRVPVIIEAVAAIVMADFALTDRVFN